MAFNSKIQFRRDTAANWTSADPTLLSGEIGVETDTNLFKIGDGATAWTSLSYAGGLFNLVEDLTPQLGGDLDVNGQSIVSVSNGDIDITPDGTGNVSLGTLVFNADQTVGAGQDDYVLTYDDATGLINLEAAAGGGLADVVDDTTPQLGGNLDVNGNDIVSTSNGDITIAPDGTGNVVLGNFTLDADQTVGAGTDNYVLTYDDGAGLVSLEAVDPDTLKSDETATLTVGYAHTADNDGTQSSGTYTPDEAGGAMKTIVNGGAFTLAPPTNNTSLVVQMTNNGSAGAITTSGFTIVTGDTLTTTDGDDFFLYITKVGSFSHLHVTALQ